MSKARTVLCFIVVVVVVMWYTSGFKHQLLTTTLGLTSTMDRTSSHKAFGSDPQASRHRLSAILYPRTTYQPSNSTNITITSQRNLLEARASIMQERLVQVAWVCKKHAKAVQRFDLFNVFKSLTVDPTHHIIYCRNAKAGTTAWLSRLLTWAGIILTNTSVPYIHNAADVVFPTLSPDKTMQELRGPALTFTVARHPFTRLASAYRNRIQTHYKSDLWPEIIRKYRKGLSNDTAVGDMTPTFREFVMFASDEVLKCLGKDRPSCLQEVDVHWLPHHDRCAPCNIQYDVIVKMETKDEDEEYLSHLLGRPLTPPTEQNAASGVSTSSLTKSFFSTLTPSERQHVFKAYEFDFLMFGYSYNDEDYT